MSSRMEFASASIAGPSRGALSAIKRSRSVTVDGAQRKWAVGGPKVIDSLAIPFDLTAADAGRATGLLLASGSPFHLAVGQCVATLIRVAGAAIGRDVYRPPQWVTGFSLQRSDWLGCNGTGGVA